MDNWTEMVTKSNPPVTNIHYSAYMDLYHLKRHVVAFDASKFKNVIGYQLRRPQVNHETLKEIIDKLNAAVVYALADPTVPGRLSDFGQEAVPREMQTPEALGAFHKSEIEKWWPIIKAANIKAD